MNIRITLVTIASSRWATPLKLGAIAGVCIGLIAAARTILAQDYLRCHLYKTAASALALAADRWLGLCVVAAYVLALVMVAEKRLGRRIRVVVNLVAAGTVLGVVLYRWGILDAVRGLSELRCDKRFFEAVRAGIRWELLAAGVGLLVLVLLLRPTGGKNQADSRLASLLKRGSRVALGNAPLFCLVAAVLLVNVAAWALTAAAAVSARGKPNVVIIMVCSLRADHLGCYGSDKELTPELDRLAATAMRFENATAQAPWTRPSVASFLSSRYPQEIGLDILRADDQYTMLAEAMRESGYATAGISSSYNAGKSVNIGQGFQSFLQVAAEEDINSPEVTRAAIQSIRKMRGKPFFLFVFYTDPHWPYAMHEGFATDGVSAEQMEASYDVKYLADATPHYRQSASFCYNSEVRFTDHHIGLVLEELKQLGLYEDTLIVFAADHGEGFGDHGLYDHGNSLYEELIHVPLIVKLPGQKDGAVTGAPVALMDVFPSIMLKLGRSASRLGLAGRAVDLTNPPARRDCVFSATVFGGASLRSAAVWPWKLIINMNALELELYNLAEDPAEKRNVLKDQPQPAADLRKAILDLEYQTGTPRARQALDPTQVFTPNELERLRSLGYLK